MNRPYPLGWCIPFGEVLSSQLALGRVSARVRDSVKIGLDVPKYLFASSGIGRDPGQMGRNFSVAVRRMGVRTNDHG